MDGKLFIIRVVVNGVGLFLLSKVLPGFAVKGFLYAFLAAALLGFLNAVIRPVLIIFTLPLTVMTMGLFLFVINALIVLLADWLLPGFWVSGFFAALLVALILSLINWLTDRVLFGPGAGGGGVIRVERRPDPGVDDDVHDLRQGGNGKWE